MKVGTLEIDLLTNMAKLSADMQQAKNAVGSAMSSIEKSVGMAVRALGGLVAGVSIGAFIGKLVSTQREFDVLNSSLITVTGSSENADRAFAWIKRFAAETPFGLNEVTGAFIKMKALGLDASEKALTSYGNTASAMGKTLNQMIEAVADAATGEFERLKEFGIKAKKEGDDVSLTFRGVTTTVKNNADEITGYLQALGENEFAGAMALRAATLDGAISNLADTWDELFRTINQQQTGSLIHDGVTLATGAIKDLITIINSLNDATDTNTEKTGALKTMQNGIATVFETVAVVGANVRFVLVEIGKDLGALAAQAAALASLNAEGAREIARARQAEGESARRDLDALEKRILNARKNAEAVAAYGRNVGAANDPRRLDREVVPPRPRGSTGTGKADKKAARAAAKDIADEAKLISELAGLNGSFYKDWQNLTDLFNKGKLNVEQLTKAQADLLAKQPAVREELKLQEDARRAEEKAMKDVERAYDDIWEKADDGIKQAKEERLALRDRREQWGQSGYALRELEAARIEENAAAKESLATLFQTIDLTGATTAKYREEADALRALADERRRARTPMEESLLERAKGDRLGGREELDAISRLRDSGDLTQEEVDRLAVEKLRGLGVDPERLQLGLDTQLEQLRGFNEQIREMEAQRVIDAQTADQAIAQNRIRMNELQLQGASDTFSALATLSSSSNKKLSALGKAAAIADATIQGILAVQKALASGVPPWSYVTAAAVGVAAAANVAKIAGVKGFISGGMGYTGDGPLSRPAGVFHGGEFVVNAGATAKNRPALEAMNNGAKVGGDAPPVKVDLHVTNQITVEGTGSQSSAEALMGAANFISKKTQADILDDARMGGKWSRVLAGQRG